MTVRGCVTRGAIGGTGFSGVGRAETNGRAAGGIGGGTVGTAPDGRGGCIGAPGPKVGRAGANGARGGVLPVTPTEGTGRGVLAGPEPGIGGGIGGTSGRGTAITDGGAGGTKTGVDERGGVAGVNTGVGARGGTTGAGGGVGARGGGGGGAITAGSSIACGSGIVSKSESNSAPPRPGTDGGAIGALAAEIVVAAGAVAPAPAVANSGALTTITPPQTEQRARTPPSGTFAGSTLKIDRQSGHVTFTAPPPW